MQSIFDAITEWLKGLLVEGIMGNLGGLFTNVNEQVGEIAAQVGTTPAAWNAGVFSMIRPVSYTHLDVYKRQECILCMECVKNCPKKAL